jgi:hypothetical protein
MSKFMLNDDDAINDVNPFVTRDFSLPGGVRQTGDFEDFTEVKNTIDDDAVKKSVFCSTNLCKDETKPCLIKKRAQPHRNIDYGFTCQEKKQPVVIVGVSNKSIPYFFIFLAIIILTLTLLYVRR